MEYSSNFFCVILGLDFIYEIAAQGRTELRIDVTAADYTVGTAIFQDFWLSIFPYYNLHIGTETGNMSTYNFKLLMIFRFTYTMFIICCGV